MIIKIFLATLVLLDGIFASTKPDAEGNGKREATPIINDLFRYFTKLVDISEFLTASDVYNMACLSNAFNESRVPANFSALSFAGKEINLPEYLSSGPEDYAFFNRYHPSQLFEWNFWMTIINVCTEGLELNSCRSSARYAATQIIDLHSAQNFSNRNYLLINLNMEKIFKLLIKYGDYDIIAKLLSIYNFRLNMQVNEIFNDKENESLLKNVALSLEEGDDQWVLISQMIDNPLGSIHGILVAMDLFPEMLAQIDLEMINSLNWRKIILHFNPENDPESNELIYNFKRALIDTEEIMLPQQVTYRRAIEYYYFGTSLINDGDQITSNSVYPFCMVAIAKRDIETLIQLFRCELITSDHDEINSEDIHNLSEAIMDNPEIFQELLPVLHDSKLGNLVISGIADFLSNGLPQDEKVQNILRIVIENYANYPGIHFNLLIFPGIQNKDLDSLMIFLLDNPTFLQQSPHIVINTVLLIETRIEKINNFMKKLIKFFPETKFNEAIILFVEKADFHCTYRLLQHPIYSKEIQKHSYDKLNWTFYDIRRIFQNDLMFQAFYPLRYEISSAEFRTFESKNILGNFSTKAEVISYLKFFNWYRMPEIRLEYYTNLIFSVERNDFNVFFEICEEDTELALKVINKTSLIHYIPRHHDSVVQILKKWIYNDERYFITRVVNNIKDVQFQRQIVIEIDSPKVKSFQVFYIFQHNENLGIELDYNIEAIRAEIEGMSAEDVSEMLREMKHCRHVYDLIIGPYEYSNFQGA